MKQETLEIARRIDEAYFGNRSIEQLLAVLFSQVESLRREPTITNSQVQTGDILFVLVAMARNLGWDLNQLLQDTITKIENRRRNRHYYEAHVTIEPIFGKRLDEFRAVCAEFGFHVATLLMQKRKKDSPKRSKNDSFCTGRSISYSDMETRMLRLVAALQAHGFQVWRYKIESTLLDSRYDDSKLPLNKDVIPEKETSPRAPADGALAGRSRYR